MANEFDEALSGLTFVDLTHYKEGHLRKKFLAGLGATVIKVEKPRGDLVRRTGLFPRIQSIAPYFLSNYL